MFCNVQPVHVSFPPPSNPLDRSGRMEEERERDMQMERDKERARMQVAYVSVMVC